MSDWADIAAAREQELREDALAERQRRQGKRHVEASAELCSVCGDPIPEARRQAVPGVQTCVPCQEELEYALRRAGEMR